MTPNDIRGSRGAVFAWIWVMIALVFAMVIVGGVTRLTGSGLSIVEWAPIMGTLPPLDEKDWLAAFAQYQQYPQYRIDHPGMTLAEFKGIFFWEYVHRLLGRAIGVVFLLPFLWFWWRGCLSPGLRMRLLGALVLGGLQGAMGWFMVKSGLVDQPRVSHFRLAAHLSIAFLIMCYLFWLLLGLQAPKREGRIGNAPFGVRTVMGVLLVAQIVYGAFVAGLRAGWGYNTFPRMGTGWIPATIGSLDPTWLNLFDNPATVQFLHRWIGTAFLLLVLWFWWRVRGGRYSLTQRKSAAVLMLLTITQYLLGVYTLLNVVPLVPAVLHQGCASLVLLAYAWVLHAFRPGATRNAGTQAS